MLARLITLFLLFDVAICPAVCAAFCGCEAVSASTSSCDGTCCRCCSTPDGTQGTHHPGTPEHKCNRSCFCTGVLPASNASDRHGSDPMAGMSVLAEVATCVVELIPRPRPILRQYLEPPIQYGGRFVRVLHCSWLC